MTSLPALLSELVLLSKIPSFIFQGYILNPVLNALKRIPRLMPTANYVFWFYHSTSFTRLFPRLSKTLASTTG